MLSVRVAQGGKVTSAEVAAPEPEHGQAVVAVRATSINRGELALIRARSAGWGPGQDVAGVVVEAAADGSGPAVGARVVGLAEQGAWSERVAVEASRLAVIPDAIDFATAAALPMAGLTALRTVRLLGSVVGRRVLITGASGGVGRLQVQLAQFSGAHVTALTRSADTIAGARVITDLQQAEPADAALESVGGTVLEGVLQRLRPNASLVWFGSSSGQAARLVITDFIGREGVTIRTYFSYATDTAEDAADLTYLLDLVGQGRLVVDIAGTRPLRQAAEALAQMEKGGTRGKLVLVNETSDLPS